MSWDPKAERIAARAEAAKTEAEAARIQAEANIISARADAELDREERRARRQERKENSQERKENRKAAREAAKESLRAQGGQLVPAAAIGAPAVIAWSGQYGFGEQVMHLGVLAPLLPVALEGGVFYSARLTHQAIDAGVPAGRYRAATWVQAGIAAGMNVWHGATAAGGSVQVGVAYGLTSLLSIAMLELTVALKAHRTSGRSAADIRAALIRRLRYPVLSVEAAAIGSARGIDASAAWTAAWVDRYGIGPDSTRSERRIAKKILKAQRSKDKKAAERSELVLVDGAITRAEDDTAEVVVERSETVAWVSDRERALTAYVSGGLAECERWLADWSIAPGAVRELPPVRDERPAGERSSGAEVERSGDGAVSAQGGEPVSGERPAGEGERPVSARGERRKGVRRRKVSAQPGGKGERLDAVRRLLDERPDMSGADISTELSIPESTARRLRARVLRERGER